MATRRKTKRFLKLRSKHKRIREKKAKNGTVGDRNTGTFSTREMRSISSTSIEHSGSLNNHSESKTSPHVSIQMSFDQARHTLPPYWVDNVDETNTLFEDINTRMTNLRRVCKKRLMAFDDREEEKLEREIGALMNTITELFKRAEKSLKRIFSAAMLPKDDRDAQVRRNIQRALATQLQNLSFDFRKQQKNYLRKIQDKKNETAGSGFFVPDESDIQEASSSNYSGFNDRQIEILQDAQQGLDERDQEIMRIAKSINDLGQIFKELAVLVIDQGTILDRIDYNMEQVEDKVEKGVEELEKAKELQKKSRPLRCVVFLLVVNAILILILYFKHKK